LSCGMALFPISIAIHRAASLAVPHGALRPRSTAAIPVAGAR
jgi:hypothetical protein